MAVKLLFFNGLILCLSGCFPINNSQYTEALSLKSESPECLSDSTYASTVTVTGSAVFNKRGIDFTTNTGQVKTMNLGNPLVNPLPIRYAEIAVYNSSNKIVQCGLTDESGNLKGLDGQSELKIPNAPDSYTLRVLARTNISLTAPKPEMKVHIAVKEDIYGNEVHYLAKTFSSNGIDNITNLDLVAEARQSTSSLDVKGGAFNIFNSILTAYHYIQNNTGIVETTCLNDKLNVYWKLGFNPFQYTYPDSNPSYLSNGSFYNKDEESLFISGGRLGDISIDVTNHFDDFVIIHELAHHIENKCGQLLSPGGNHYILSRIDARLAWAEGWANYFAAQVLYDSTSIAHINPEIGTKLTSAGLSARWTYLFGSKGFTDTTQGIDNGTGLMFDLTKAGNNPDSWQYGPYLGSLFDKVDPARYPGEGHFREGAVTRGLFKLTNNCGGSCTTSTPITFENMWKSMDKITGVGQDQYIFKSSHDFLKILKSLIGNATWASDYVNFNQSNTSEALHLFSDGIFTETGINRWIPYGTYLTTLVTSGDCTGGTYYIEPRTDDPVLTATNSDQRYSNHFYTLDLNTIALSSVDEINVTFEKKNSSGSITEFDLLLFQEDYFFSEDYVCSASNSSGTCTSYLPQRTTSSDVLRSDRRAGSYLTKTIKNLKALDKTKKYLLNIRAYTANKTISSVTDYAYEITDQLGQKICP